MEGSDKNVKHSAISHTKKEKVQEHTIFVNGSELHQRKEMSAVNPKIKPGLIQYRHMRRIDNDSIEVIEVREDDQVISKKEDRRKGAVAMSHSEAEVFLKKWDLMWQTGIQEPLHNGKLEAMKSYNVVPTKDTYPMPQNLIRVEEAVATQDLVSADKLTKAQPRSFLTMKNRAEKKERASPGQVSKEEKVRQVWVSGQLQKEERVSKSSNTKPLDKNADDGRDTPVSSISHPGKISKEYKVKQLWISGKLKKEEKVSRCSNSNELFSSL